MLFAALNAVKTGKMQLQEAQQGIAKDRTPYRDAALKYCAANKCGSGRELRKNLLVLRPLLAAFAHA
jgi:hypothetical protein